MRNIIIADNSSLSRETALILLVFFLLSLTGILHHEIWLDEAQHFLLSRDSKTFTELFQNSRYEGHPLLWNIILFMVTRFTRDVFYMQLVHILISCITVLIICKSKISLLEKIVIIFGYWLFFEYNIISRNYGLSACLMFLLWYEFQKDQSFLIRFAVIIFFLANTHLFSLIFSMAFVLTTILNKRENLLNKNKKNIYIAAVIILAGWILSFYCIFPPGHYASKFISYDPSGYFSTERILKTIGVCLKGIFYIPDYRAPEHQFENSFYYLTLNLRIWAIYLLSISAIVLPVLVIKINRFALTLFVLFMVIFLPLYYFLPLVHGIRYFGFFYLLFVFCFLLARKQMAKTWLTISVLIFTLQFFNGIYAYCMDLRWPFSESKNISGYIEKISKGHERVYILKATLRPAISAYTGEKYFGTENGHMLSFCLWPEHQADSVLKSKLAKALDGDTNALIISTYQFTNLIDSNCLIKLESFDEGIIEGENAVVYRYNPIKFKK